MKRFRWVWSSRNTTNATVVLKASVHTCGGGGGGGGGRGRAHILFLGEVFIADIFTQLYSSNVHVYTLYVVPGCLNSEEPASAFAE